MIRRFVLGLVAIGFFYLSIGCSAPQNHKKTKEGIADVPEIFKFRFLDIESIDVIDQNSKTIQVTLLDEKISKASMLNLVAVIEYTGFTIKLNGVVQENGKTPNDFSQSETNPMKYEVISLDGKSVSYSVLVSLKESTDVEEGIENQQNQQEEDEKKETFLLSIQGPPYPGSEIKSILENMKSDESKAENISYKWFACENSNCSTETELTELTGMSYDLLDADVGKYFRTEASAEVSDQSGLSRKSFKSMVYGPIRLSGSNSLKNPSFEGGLSCWSLKEGSSGSNVDFNIADPSLPSGNSALCVNGLSTGAEYSDVIWSDRVCVFEGEKILNAGFKISVSSAEALQSRVYLRVYYYDYSDKLLGDKEYDYSFKAISSTWLSSPLSWYQFDKSGWNALIPPKARFVRLAVRIKSTDTLSSLFLDDFYLNISL